MESDFEIRERLEAKLELAEENIRDFKPSYSEVADAFMSGEFDTDEARSLGFRLDFADEAEEIRSTATKELNRLRAKENVHNQIIFSAERDAGAPFEPVTKPFSPSDFRSSILGDASDYLMSLTNGQPIKPSLNVLFTDIKSPQITPLQSINEHNFRGDDTKYIADIPLKHDIDRYAGRTPGFAYDEDLLDGGIRGSRRDLIGPDSRIFRVGDFVHVPGEGWINVGTSLSDAYSDKAPKPDGHIDSVLEERMLQRERDRIDGGLTGSTSGRLASIDPSVFDGKPLHEVPPFVAPPNPLPLEGFSVAEVLARFAANKPDDKFDRKENDKEDGGL